MDKKSVFQMLLLDLVEACKSYWGERLIGILHFGSTVRRLKPVTDLDLFIIISELPPDRLRQHDEWEAIESALRSRLAQLDRAGCHLDLSPILKTPSDLRRFSTLFLDFPGQGKVLFSRDGAVESFLDRIRRQIEATGARRVRRGLLSYWVIRPGMKYNEEVSTDWIVEEHPAGIE